MISINDYLAEDREISFVFEVIIMFYVRLVQRKS